MSSGTGDLRAQVQQVVDFFEGGLSDHPADKGGLTKYGVTFSALQRARPLATPEDVKALTKDEAIDILTQHYVIDPGLARIFNDALRFAVIDYAIYSGPATAIRALQRIVGMEADGILGDATATAVNAFDSVSLMRLFVAQRLRHLGRIITNDPRQHAFAAGWINRVATVLEAA